MIIHHNNPQMLLKTTLTPNPFFLHTNFPKTLIPRNPNHFRSPSIFLHITSSVSNDTKTLPQSAIQRIADKLRSLGYVEDTTNSHPQQTLSTSPGEIFVPLPNQLPKHRVGHTLDPSWSTPENPVPEPGSGTAITRYHEIRREVWKERKEEKIKRRIDGSDEREREREELPTMAELKVPREELRRLRGAGIAIKKTLKIGKAGITEGIVNGIHERWRKTELVKIVCEDMCRLNMKRTHDLLERKTGGLVVWRSGSIIILYRGADYKYPYFFVNKTKPIDESVRESTSSPTDSEESDVQENHGVGTDVASGRQTNTTEPPLIQGVGSRTRVRFQLPGEAQLTEEADQLLHGLGPRFTDWYGYDPQPVDADLLPAIVPGYRKPFRLLPFGVQPKLTNDEMTILRRLGRPLPCHFALGRNRKHQGLAAAILKLWEKCEIAKIAVKRGVQNTNSELMAEEIRWLTGGTLLTRDKEYIVLYRGKDFLPATVSSAIEQRRNREVDEHERKKIASSSDVQANIDKEIETPSAAKRDGMRDQKLEVAIEQRKQKSRELAIKKTNSKLSQALVDKEKAEKLLEELGKEETKQEFELDKEGITEEERYMLRKVGVKMGPFLLLGRRGVFDGTVENMHLHWKYRELVKIISGERSIDEVHATARTLEAESGGILVAVERVRKGHAIIVYRGKNYERPATLRPQTLLNKKEALKRSIEAQRRESLKLHVLKLGKNVEELKLKLSKNEKTGVDGEKGDNIDVEQEMTSLLADVDPDSDFKVYKSNPIDQDNGQVGRDLHGGAVVISSENDSLKASQESPEKDCEDGSSEFSMEFKDADDVEYGVSEVDMIIPMDSEQTGQQDPLTVSSVKHSDKDECEFIETNSKASTILVEETNENDKAKTQNTSISSDVFKVGQQEGSQSAEPFVSVMTSEVPVSPVNGLGVNESNGIPRRSALLSNKERLLLRKQALKMKKRPVLAIGKGNIVSGVAKTIKTHFQKYPLAIVNIKGRARGTSAQEVVSKLEEATGAVLVSQEPNKVILYRGWGASTTKDSKQTNLVHEPNVRERIVKPVISPELISAIRLECGL